MEPYVTEHLPPEGIDWASLAGLIGRANRALGGYDGIVQGIVNPDILLAPLEAREAVLSSRIEGTQASLEDVLAFESEEEALITTARAAEIQEVNNYRRAMRQAETELSSRPVGINVLRELHRTLLSGVRGRDKEPGAIRTRQVFIGTRGATIEQATFVPPEPSLVMDSLTDWENYLHTEERDPIVQVAVLKGQFELIHPFLDGNGRIGRMLVPLILSRKGVIRRPNFYISASIERDRDAYYDRLAALSRARDWNGWIAFFLDKVIEQAGEDAGKARAIQDLYHDMKYRVSEVTRSQFAVPAVDTLFTRPVFTPPQFATLSRIPKASANRLLADLFHHDILVIRSEGRGRRATVYEFPELLRVVNGSAGE